MNLPDLSTVAGLECLDRFLLDKSFLSGYQLTPADFQAFRLVSVHSTENYDNVKRWYSYVKAHASEAKSLNLSASAKVSYRQVAVCSPLSFQI